MRISSRYFLRGVLIGVATACLISGHLLALRAAEEKADPKPNPKIDLAEGQIVLMAPDGWVRKTPKVRFIDHEFAVPAEKGDTEDGRVTVMGAGGTVDANVERWIGQFSQVDGSETKNQIAEANRKKTISGLEVRFVDLAGTYKEMSRPFDPNAAAVERKDYRMLAAIIASPKLGNYFIKFYGPRQTITAHADEFRKMFDRLKVK